MTAVVDIGQPTGVVFALGDDTFAAHASAAGYVWACGQMMVGHAWAERALWPCPPGTEPERWAASATARRHYWAALGGRRSGNRHRLLVEAMRTAVAERDRRRWAKREIEWPASAAV